MTFALSSATTLYAAAVTRSTPTFTATTDALEALRDRGDAAWITATGFSTHSAADVWAAATRTLTAGTNIGFPTAAQNAEPIFLFLLRALDVGHEIETLRAQVAASRARLAQVVNAHEEEKSALVRQLVAAHGGTFELLSEPGAGTSAMVTLP